MTRIRVDTKVLEQEAQQIESVGDNTISVGRSLIGATRGAPSYDGQFAPVVQSISTSGFAQAQGLSGQISQFGHELDSKASAFEAVDGASTRLFSPDFGWKIDLRITMPEKPWLWDIRLYSIFPMPVLIPPAILVGFIPEIRSTFTGMTSPSWWPWKPAPIPNVVSSAETPPPRIYLINGIRSSTEDGKPDERMQEFEHLIENYGYSRDDVTTLNAVYNGDYGTHWEGSNWKGTDWSGTGQDGLWGAVTGAGAWIVNKTTGTLADGTNWTTDKITGATNWTTDNMFNTLVGAVEVGQEYSLEDGGQYTQEAYRNIMDDINEHPLDPGQEVILIGHSGGGAIVANLPDMLERRGIEVEGVVTMGSPLAKIFKANNDSRHVVELQADGDWLVGGWKDVMTMGRSTELSTGGGDHNSYLTSQNVIRLLGEEFPAFQAGMSQCPVGN